jgi:hypothetical protein
MTDEPRTNIDTDAVLSRLNTALERRTRLTVWTSLCDLIPLVAEIERLTKLLAWVRIEFANLMAAARATLAADRDGEPDPLSYLRDEVDSHDFTGGQK